MDRALEMEERGRHAVRDGEAVVWSETLRGWRGLVQIRDADVARRVESASKFHLDVDAVLIEIDSTTTYWGDYFVAQACASWGGFGMSEDDVFIVDVRYDIRIERMTYTDGTVSYPVSRR